MSIEDCARKAKNLISENGICLLLFDVRNSKRYDGKLLNQRLKEMMADLNKNFYAYLPKNNLAVLIRKERGFQTLAGDSSWAGINFSEAVREIADYQAKHYPEIKLYWGVAKDGFDEEGTAIAR